MATDFDPRNSAGAGSVITLIRDLNPYQNSVIRAKVMFKAPVKEWTNAKGSGKFISVDLADASGEIKCTIFNDDIALFENTFVVGKTVEISKPQIKPANAKFNKSKYEMSLSKTSLVRAIDESLVKAPEARFKFVEIDHIQDLAVNDVIDLLGVVTSVGDISNIKTKKDQRDLAKRDVNIADKSKREVTVAIWGELASTFEAKVGDVIAVKNVRVSEYRDAKQLSSTMTSQFFVNPAKIAEATELQQWYSANQGTLASELLSISSPAKTGAGPTFVSEEISLKELVEKGLAQSAEDKAAFATVVATIMWGKHDEKAVLVYKAAPGLNAKVTATNDGQWYCAKTGKNYPTFEARYILTFAIADPTSNEFISVFDEAGQQILSEPASTIQKLKDLADAGKKGIDEIFSKVIGQRLVFKLRAKEEAGDGQYDKKMRLTVQSVAHVDYASESRKLLEKINRYYAA